MGQIDLTNHVEKDTFKTIVSVKVRLDKKTMLDILSKEAIFIRGNYYKVPEKQILICLMNGNYGETQLNLELIKKQNNG